MKIAEGIAVPRPASVLAHHVSRLCGPIQSRVFGNTVLKHNGFSFRPAYATEVYMALGIWEPYLKPFFHLKPGQCFFDVGAHIGYYTVRASSQVGSMGRVVAVEPDPSNLAMLRKNLQARRSANVTVVPYPVSDRCRTVDFRSAKNPLFSAVDGSRGRSMRMAATTVDAIADSLKIDTVDLMKIDVEGGEYRVLVGALG